MGFSSAFVDGDLEIDLDAESDALDASRPWRWRWAAGALVLLAGLGGGVWWWQAAHSRSAPTQTVRAPLAVTVRVAAARAAGPAPLALLGTLEARESAAIYPPLAGRVRQVRVAEGQRVTAGTPLFDLEPDPAAVGPGSPADLETLEAAVASRAIAVDRERAQVNARQAELAALQEEWEARQLEAQSQAADYDRLAQLHAEGAIETQQLDRVAAARDRAAAEARALQRRIEAAEQQVAAARAQVQQAELAAAEARSRLTLAQAEASTEAARETVVRAPIDGTVGDLAAQSGDAVAPGDRLTAIVRNTVMILRLAVPLTRAADLQVDLSVAIADAEGRALGSGRIEFVAPQADRASQTVLVKVAVPNPDGRLVDGQSVRAQFFAPAGTGSVTVPRAAIAGQDESPYVYAVEGPPAAPVARRRRVRLGDDSQGDRVVVLDGLDLGDRVVVSSLQRLSDGMPLAIAAIEGATADEGSLDPTGDASSAD